MERAAAIREMIKDELDQEDRAREEAYNASRMLIRSCREQISGSVRTDSGAGVEMLESRLSGFIASLPGGMSGRWGFVEDALGEAAEAIILSRILDGGEIPAPDATGIPCKAYVMGACDTVGELRRCVLNSLLAGNHHRARDLFDRMCELSGVMEGLVYPSGMVNLKKKQDAVRYILDRTQGDLVVSLSLRGRTMEDLEGPLDERQ